MCTAVSFKSADHYFGRNLDLDFHYDEAITVMPRKFHLSFRGGEIMESHFAIIGTATVVDDYPLYYDAVNEFGLGMAGLNFPHFAEYYPRKEGVFNIAPFELIPWVLAQCKTAADAKSLIAKTNIWNHSFNSQYPLTPLHWIIADSRECFVIEPRSDKMHIMDNPVGVLTNSPPLDYHLCNLANYMNLSTEDDANRFADNLSLSPYSRGMGAIGLPGDLSSASRFVRAAFVKCNSVCNDDEMSSVNQFFHILGAVEQQNGCCRTKGGLEKTIYSNCYNTERGICYYVTYENRQICAVDMHRENLESRQLMCYDMFHPQQVKWINEQKYCK